MVKCWASGLGNCSNVQSKEHYISQGLWEDNSVTIEGFDWLNGEAKTVGLGSLQAKILCEAHNNALSPLDSEAKRVFKTIEEFNRLTEVRKKLNPKGYWTVKRYHMNGTLFERWAGKFLAGIFCVVGKDKVWYKTQTPSLEPPNEIVRAIYGLERFIEPLGLYLAYNTGDLHYHTEGLSITPLFHPDGGLAGANLEFQGFQFVIWLIDEPISSLIFPTSKGNIKKVADFTYRPTDLIFRERKIRSQVLAFEWEFRR